MGDHEPERWRAAATRTPSGAPVEAAGLTYFATGTTILRFGDGAAPARQPPGDTPATGPGRAKPPSPLRRPTGYHARPGRRPGTVPPFSDAAISRRGRATDIVRPLHVPPGAAIEILRAGRVLERVANLRVDLGAPSPEHWLAWSATLTTPRRRIPASLRIRTSPSMVVTVLELLPARRLHVGQRRFVEVAVAAIDTLALRIERAARSH